MTIPSPIFTINTTAITDSVEVAAGVAVACLLVDITGVSPVDWAVEGTDETKVPGDYTFTQAGGVGQQFNGTALTSGTAVTIRCTVNGGIDPTTGEGGTNMTARGKFWVPTLDGREVLTVDEHNDDNMLSSATHGMERPLNEAIRGSPIVAEYSVQCGIGGTLNVLDYTMAEQTLLEVECTLTAHDIVNDDCAAYVLLAAYKRLAGIAILQPAPNAIHTSEDDAGWGLVAAVDGANNAQMVFTGDAANLVDVQAKFRIKVQVLA